MLQHGGVGVDGLLSARQVQVKGVVHVGVAGGKLSNLQPTEMEKQGRERGVVSDIFKCWFINAIFALISAKSMNTMLPCFSLSRYFGKLSRLDVLVSRCSAILLRFCLIVFR